ncbi:MHYT domain-containing protein [Bosea sp. BK604]|uniref:MHYT domain-containing protein n=1 Tax=Bosea sp. BK604 TaxID=2512180 RepID=UPI001044B55A|nr:MHYT domain-containing protein [Bosea sp. BK604]TCR60632.1 NO-binding membrane sensor protein with MHYT domain [Bosea sp. BK604]
MFAGHNFQLVALSVAIAITGGYTGFGLAARVRGTRRSRRMLLAGAAGLLAVSIWTMHFVGMLAAPIPTDAVYLVLPTIVSFLICALVVGVSLFFVSIGPDSNPRIAASALLLGLGIVSMHYVGVHGLAGNFAVEHDIRFVLLAGAIAVGAGYGGLRIFLARHGGTRLLLSAVAFGIAVSGMHYTAMLGMRFVPGGHAHMAMDGGLSASPQVLAPIVALLCFLIVASFLLFLVPEPRLQSLPAMASGPSGRELDDPGLADIDGRDRHANVVQPLPLGGLGQPRPARAGKVPVEVPDGTQLIDAAEIRSIRANAHYTYVHDGARERLSPWSISQAEAALDAEIFVRVHRSHIVAVQHVTLIRKEGDGAVVELGGLSPHRVPVSRAKIAEVKARLGLLHGISR